MAGMDASGVVGNRSSFCGSAGCGGWRARQGAWTSRLLLGALAGLVCASAGMAQSLDRKVQSALANARLGNAQVGVSILDIQTGEMLVNIEPSGSTHALIPASNHKLITSGAATLVLGKNFEFETKIIVDGTRVIVQGAGDPAFADPELLDNMKMSVEDLVDRLVDSVKKTGAKGITEVVVDDRVFDRDYVHNDWPADQLTRAYCAEVSGLNFHGNVLNVYVSPGKGGGEPIVRTEPNGPWLTVRKAARTTREGNTEVWIEREKDPFTFKVHGTVRTAVIEPVQVTVHEPGLMFARYFADRLTKGGLGASGTPIQGRLVAATEQLDLSPNNQVAGVVRTPLSVVLERCNVDSDNLYAESLAKLAGQKVTGQAGTWASGTAVIRMQLKDKLGAELASEFVLADGSGLSRNNRVSAEGMTRWLKVMSDDKSCGEMFVNSLALAGEEGTLRKRFRGAKLKNEVRAKSGYIREVRTLSGYVTNPTSGRRVAFSVLVNNYPPGTDGRAKEFHEDVVEAVDAWLADKSKGAPANTTVDPDKSNKIGG